MSENQTRNTQGGAVLHVDPTVGDGVVNVPGGDMFLVADYVREGSDLVLVGRWSNSCHRQLFRNGEPACSCNRSRCQSSR